MRVRNYTLQILRKTEMHYADKLHKMGLNSTVMEIVEKSNELFPSAQKPLSYWNCFTYNKNLKDFPNFAALKLVGCYIKCLLKLFVKIFFYL